MSDGEACHETVDAKTREAVLTAAAYRCGLCGDTGPQAGGTATLQVHHATRDPDEMDEHDRDNLVALCRSCHNWHHHKATGDDLPFTLTEADRAKLLPHDIEILEALAEIGPATTGDLMSALSSDFSDAAVRERLWKLMALDNTVAERDEQLVDQDADTGEWGLTSQISTSARGRIPDDTQKLLQRAEDERVRRARDRGFTQATVAEVFDVVERTAWHKEARARAYEFPLAALESHRRRTASDESQTEAAAAAETESADDTDDNQQRLAEVTSSDGPASADEAVGAESTDATVTTDGGSGTDLETHIEQAIDALEALRAAV